MILHQHRTRVPQFIRRRFPQPQNLQPTFLTSNQKQYQIPTHICFFKTSLAVSAMSDQQRTKVDNNSIESNKERIHLVKSPFLTTDTKKRNVAQGDEYVNVMIILNSPIERFTNVKSSSLSSNQKNYTINPIFDKLWDISSYRVCADGGANRLYDVCHDFISSSKNKKNDTRVCNDSNDNLPYIPDLIKGDLDSLHENVKTYYQSRGCKIIQDFDQDTNDLDKALTAVCEWWKSKRIEEEMKGNAKGANLENRTEIQIYIYGAFGGRFDQEMASIQALYKWSSVFNYRIFLYNHETCSWLLKPMNITSTKHEDDKNTNVKMANDIQIRNDVQIPFFGEEEGVSDEVQIGEGPTCGLIPIACRSDSVKTTGLKWNLDGSSSSTLEFGGLVSSSNRVMNDVVSIYTSAPLVFTAEIIIKNT